MTGVSGKPWHLDEPPGWAGQPTPALKTGLVCWPALSAIPLGLSGPGSVLPEKISDRNSSWLALQGMWNRGWVQGQDDSKMIVTFESQKLEVQYP